jgi:hypothetical protein
MKTWSSSVWSCGGGGAPDRACQRRPRQVQGSNQPRTRRRATDQDGSGAWLARRMRRATGVRTLSSDVPDQIVPECSLTTCQ